MSDEVWKRAEIESPCIKLCVIDSDTGLCAGCHRSLAEIGDWSRLSPERRHEIMAELPARAAQPRRKGGRRGRQGRGPTGS